MNTCKLFFGLLTAFLLLSTTTVVTAQKADDHFYMPEINCIDVKLPLTFSWVNYDNPGKEVPPAALKKIQSIITDFYLESNGGDSSDMSRAKDYYFQTLRTPINAVQLYIVILKTPLQYAHCKLFLYDTATDSVSKTTADYNIWAMYTIDENTMRRSDLYKELKLNSDDITLVHGKRIILKRLKHGTYNEWEQTTYQPDGLRLDSIAHTSETLYSH